jgi:transglutaminase-like putative cysteine protease
MARWTSLRGFEAFLDGHWYTFDARNNTPRIGRVLIARGRNAFDVAISITFGPNTLTAARAQSAVHWSAPRRRADRADRRAGLVEAMKSMSTATKRSGASQCG